MGTFNDVYVFSVWMSQCKPKQPVWVFQCGIIQL